MHNAKKQEEIACLAIMGGFYAKVNICHGNYIPSDKCKPFESENAYWLILLCIMHEKHYTSYFLLLVSLETAVL